eukprot:TRINITY_DN12933_c0_g1_i1.p1 TRINITY_DN12933_c0_g1~~TRINITY_DN12933_c0_g1_i1.p1  ORF type:complete len:134 (+),score=11.30 TRINITY_DN12933_c0_g1_i1:28-429(+)
MCLSAGIFILKILLSIVQVLVTNKNSFFLSFSDFVFMSFNFSFVFSSDYEWPHCGGFGFEHFHFVNSMCWQHSNDFSLSKNMLSFQLSFQLSLGKKSSTFILITNLGSLELFRVACDICNVAIHGTFLIYVYD